jgi:DNA-binding MarR family transcriptional regulator
METLSKLFGSEAKVKIIRLFLFNPEIHFSLNEISEKTKENQSKVRKELNSLEKCSLVKKKVTVKVTLKGRRKESKSSTSFVLNNNFLYINQLQNLLINQKPLEHKEIVRKISRLGPVKLIIVAGVFIQDSESRVDILVVGDHIKKTALDNIMKNIEAEVGKEIRYAYFSTEDFKYRLSMFDKLIRDILDYPHEKIVNKLGNI